MHMDPVINGALLAVFTVVIAWLGKGRFDAIDRRFTQVDARFDRTDARLDRIEAEIAELRSMIMQLAIALGVPRPQTG